MDLLNMATLANCIPGLSRTRRWSLRSAPRSLTLLCVVMTVLPGSADAGEASLRSARPIATGSCLSLSDTLAYSSCYGDYSTIFACDFESGVFGCGGWSVEGGTWEVGAPTPPPSPHGGFGVAGTILAGNYSNSIDARLVSKNIALPALAGCETLELRFWHYFQTQLNADRGNVEIATRRGAVWGPWQGVRNNPSKTYSGFSSTWTAAAYDLSSYADSTVRISFRFRSDGCCTVDRGWYLDDVVVRKGGFGPPTGPVVESFDAGLGEWWVDSGQWTGGAPAAPVASHSGSGCASTGLLANYGNSASTRLVSPPYELPAVAACEALRLRYWQYFRSQLSADRGTVEISTRRGSIWGPFLPARGGDPAVSGFGIVWSSPSLDLTSYADSTIRVAFRFDTDGCCTVDRGWFIDDVAIVKGPLWTSVEYPNWETFEAGAPDWSVDAGEWETGIPTVSVIAHTGDACAGTVLGGDYGNSASSRLISPPFRVGPIEGSPALRFWHWYLTQNGPDRGVVEVSTLQAGVWGAWQQIGGPYTNTSGGIWTPTQLSLEDYADTTIRIAFHFLSDGCCTTSRGWYIDDVQVLGAVTDTGEDPRATSPQPTRLYPNVPNPFNPSTTIRFDLAVAGHAALRILDVAGRQVRSIPLGNLASGQHSLVWDGKLDSGSSAASGVYFYRLETADTNVSRSMMLVR